MASITKRGDYQWQALVRKGGVKAVKTFLTEQEAEEWSKEVESQITKGVYIDKSHLKKYTLSDLLDEMLETAIPPKKGASREISFVGRLKRHPIAEMTLNKISPNDIRDYRDGRLKSVSTSTVAKEMAMMSSYFNYAISEFVKYQGLTNPVTPIRRPTPRRGRSRRYNEGETEWIIKHTESNLLGDVLNIALETSMRRGEIMAGIYIEHIDLEHRAIHLTDSKNSQSRTVAFPSKLIPLFKRRIGKRTSGRLFVEAPDAATRAFCRARDRARKAYETECREKGQEPDPNFLKDIRLHDARHEATSRLFEDHNLSIQEVASMTGHMDLKMLKRYTHMTAWKIAQKLG